MGPHKTELVARGYTLARTVDRVKLDKETLARVTQEAIPPETVCDLLDALFAFAESKGVSRYPEGTFLHRLRAAT